jgi:hypothetical protein
MMTSDKIVYYIISGACSFFILLLSAIWREIKIQNKKLDKVIIGNAKISVRIEHNEKLITELPCKTSNCAAGRKNADVAWKTY